MSEPLDLDALCDEALELDALARAGSLEPVAMPHLATAQERWEAWRQLGRTRELLRLFARELHALKLRVEQLEGRALAASKKGKGR